MGKSNTAPLPPIPPKRYFTIGEVAHLCRLQPHVLRYWEGEFPQLRPIKRDGNRRYYREHEILLIRRIRELLYEHGFTIQGARQALRRKGDFPEIESVSLQSKPVGNSSFDGTMGATGIRGEAAASQPQAMAAAPAPELQSLPTPVPVTQPSPVQQLPQVAASSPLPESFRQELVEIIQLLS